MKIKTGNIVKRLQRQTYLSNWHAWFAWYPVKVAEYEYRWLEYVNRRILFHLEHTLYEAKS